LPSPVALRDVVPYLLDTGLLTPAAIVDGDLRVAAHKRRNLSFSVAWGDNEGVFLKQLTPGETGGRSESLLYGLARGSLEPALASLPQLRRFDRERDLLVLELVRPTTPIWSLIELSDVESISVFDRLGTTLAHLHALFQRWELPAGFAKSPWALANPWGFRACEVPLHLLGELSAANARLLQILTTEIPPSVFAAGQAAWRPSTLIHYDFKSDNVLTPAPGAIPRIVDWEFAAWGDPAWDVGTMLQSLLGHWLHHESLEERGDVASPLPAVQARCAAFWAGYAAATGFDLAGRRSFAARAALFSAFRLFQSAYEAGHRRDRFERFALMAVQVAANIASNPDRAAAELYGIG
jgi:hypothetical protein